MATVIYINQNCIKILDGHQTQENYYVKDYKKRTVCTRIDSYFESIRY